jgi:cyclophilin family peptidyl-prolyl cis-trans isomerase
VFTALLAASALALTPEDAQIILQIEAQRLPPLALASYVAADDPDTRARAARALGRLRTAAAIAPLRRLVADPQVAVRQEAAHALGQTPGSGRVSQERLPDEPDVEVRRRLLLALGTQGDEDAIPVLLTALAAPPRLLRRPVEGTAAAHALGRLAMRDVAGARESAVTAALLDALQRADVALQRGAAFALARQDPPGLPDALRARLERATAAANDATARAFLVRALGNTGGTSDEVLAALSTDPSPGVRIAVARAAGRLGWTGVTALLDDEETAVRLEAIAAVGALEALDRTALLEPIVHAGSTLEAAEAWRTDADPSLHAAAAAVHALGAAGLLEGATGLVEGTRPTKVRVAATAWLGDPEAWARLALEDGEGPVRTAAAGALVASEPAAPTLRTLLPAFDPMVAALAAEALVDKPHKNNQDPLLAALADAEDPDLLAAGMRALAPLYTGTYPKVKKPDSAAEALAQAHAAHPAGPVRDAARALLEALGEPAPEPWHQLVNAPEQRALAARSARMRTSRGDVVLALLPEEAPLTVWSFATLAEDGYFDRLTWHRVVPDFVVQTGDPRGDGMGGPGYTIPDEINPVPYDEGVVGMALSGPDTGGSQWFITLSPQPHLDGTYTVFGKVVRGQHVLARLREGDRIERLTIEWSDEDAKP